MKRLRAGKTYQHRAGAIEMQSRVAKIYERANVAAGEKLFDWGGAENATRGR